MYILFWAKSSIKATHRIDDENCEVPYNFLHKVEKPGHPNHGFWASQIGTEQQYYVAGTEEGAKTMHRDLLIKNLEACIIALRRLEPKPSI